MARYRYTPRLAPLILASLFFGVAGVLMVSKARTNRRGLIINGVIELGPEGATVFYWVLAATGFAFVAAALAAFTQRLGPERYVEFDDEAISIPHRWTRRIKRVPYAKIHAMQLETVSGQRFLRILHGERSDTIGAVMLESDDTLGELAAELHSRVEALRSAR